MRGRLLRLLLLLTMLLAIAARALAADPAWAADSTVVANPTVTVGYLPVATQSDSMIIRGTGPRGMTLAISVNGELQGRVIAGPSMDVYWQTVTLTPGENRIQVALEGTTSTVERWIVHTTAAFTDLAPDYWAKDDIEVLATLGVVNGIGDGLFGPEAPLTRAQFAKLLALGLGLTPADEQPAFADAAAIPGWARGYVATAVAEGLIKGYEDGTFRPDNQVTRAEVAVIAARAVRLKGIGKSRVPIAFTDADQIPAWAQGDVVQVTAAGIIEKYWGEAFLPAQPATRALTAAAIRRLWSGTRATGQP